MNDASLNLANIQGIALKVIALLAASVGRVLIRKAHTQEAGKRVAAAVASLCLFVINPITDIWALALAPQSMLAPFAGLNVVFNLVLAHFTLGEPVGMRDAFGTGALTVGCALVAASFGSAKAKHYSLDELVTFYYNPYFVCYAVCTAALLAALTLTLFRDIKNTRRSWLPVSRAMCYATISGVLQGNQFFTKSFAELVSQIIKTGGANIWSLATSPMSFVIVVGVISSTVGALWVLSEGLRHFDATRIVPTSVSVTLVFATLSGMTYFQESPASWSLYSLGILFVALGLRLVQRQQGRVSPEQIQKSEKG